MIQVRFLASLTVLGIFVGLLSGCGSSESGPATAKSDTSQAESVGAEEKKTATAPLTTASISSPAATAEEEVEAEVEDTAQSLIAEIQNLQRQPLGKQATQADGKVDRKQFMGLLKERNEEVVKLASQAVLLAHKSKAGDEVMHQAVKRLSEARLQLALAGDQEQIDLLYQDAETLKGIVPKSKAAMESAYAVVRFVNTNAKRFGANDKEIITEFSRQARSFSESFPEEQAKTLPLLLAAGETCERYGLIDEAKLCFVQVYDQYPKTAQAIQAKGVERRLGLKGQLLKFGGATYTGEHFSIKHTRGKVTVIVYWRSNIQGIQNFLKQVDAVAKQFDGSQLELVGVCLDEDELQLEQTIGEAGLNWKQLIDPDANKRGTDHPVVKYYGVRQVPSIWVVDAEGVVVNTSAGLKTLQEELSAQF